MVHLSHLFSLDFFRMIKPKNPQYRLSKKYQTLPFSTNQSNGFHQITFLHGRKGNPKIIFGGNGYHRHGNSRTSGRTYWLCWRNRANKCNARLMVNRESREVMLKNHVHTHRPVAFEYRTTDVLKTFRVVEMNDDKEQK